MSDNKHNRRGEREEKDSEGSQLAQWIKVILVVAEHGEVDMRIKKIDLVIFLTRRSQI